MVYPSLLRVLSLTGWLSEILLPFLSLQERVNFVLWKILARRLNAAVVLEPRF